MHSTRRRFLQSVGTVAAVTAALPTVARAADEPLRMGCIGCGGQGSNLARSFASQSDVRVEYVCDPDAARAEKLANELASSGAPRPTVVADLRRVLDDAQIRAVTVATPDHWHVPAALLAVAAGKHVYVEKPVSHNLRGGCLLGGAAPRHRRVVQVGTQSRSAPHIRAAIERLQQGAIGQVLVAKAWNSQLRGNIGHAQPTGQPPAGFDYELWQGSAPHRPFHPNCHHYTWHWWYDFGTGDMGNDGVHELDIARWGLGVETQPSQVAGLGGKLAFDDDQQFPDTQYVAFWYEGQGQFGQRRQLLYEHRLWSNYVQEGHENGNAFYGTDGLLILGKATGWKLYGPKNELRESMEASGLGLPHHRDFLEAIRQDRRPAADVEIGHLSASLCHLGNLAVRLGRTLRLDPASEKVLDDPQAQELTGRRYEPGHWAVPAGV